MEGIMASACLVADYLMITPYWPTVGITVGAFITGGFGHSSTMHAPTVNTGFARKLLSLRENFIIFFARSVGFYWMMPYCRPSHAP